MRRFRIRWAAVTEHHTEIEAASFDDAMHQAFAIRREGQDVAAVRSSRELLGVDDLDALAALARRTLGSETAQAIETALAEGGGEQP